MGEILFYRSRCILEWNHNPTQRVAKRKAPRYAVGRGSVGGRGRTSTQLATTSKPNTE